MAQINLLKNELQERAVFGRAGLVPLYIALGVLGLEVLIYGGLYLYNSTIEKQISDVERQYSDTNAEINRLSPDLQEGLAYQTRLRNLQILLDNHIFWSPVLEELSKSTYRSVSYDSLEADQVKHRLVVQGVAPSYTDIAKLILGLKTSRFINDVSLLSSGRSKSEKAGFNFSMEIDFDPSLLNK